DGKQDRAHQGVEIAVAESDRVANQINDEHHNACNEDGLKPRVLCWQQHSMPPQDHDNVETLACRIMAGHPRRQQAQTIEVVRCELTARNDGSFVAPACAFILIKSVYSGRPSTS